MFYLDCDTTPALASRWIRHRTVKGAKAKAMELLVNVNEGQIGVYADYFGNGFAGYAIRDHDAGTMYFEDAPQE